MLAALRTCVLAATMATAALASIIPPQARADGQACGYGTQGLKQPAEGSTVVLHDQDSTGADIEVLYCSGAYSKISSESVSVWLANSAGSNSGQLLAQNIKPDNKDAPSGYFSYRFNVTVSPQDGDYPTGPHAFSIYEVTTGEFFFFSTKDGNVLSEWKRLAR